MDIGEEVVTSKQVLTMPDLTLKISGRLYGLVEQGNRLLETFDVDIPIGFQQRSECLSWMLSAVNILEVAMPANSRYRIEAARLLPATDVPLYPENLATILGILKSAAAEWAAGLIGTLEFHFIGLAFEDFLRLAAEHNENGKKEVAAVLASAVLEDTVKRLCRKHNVEFEDKSLDTLISALKTMQILGKVKAERLRSHAKLRNQAFHAEWDAFDQRDLRQMIEDVQELVETHFGELPI
ncbi:MAG: hypothetical protein ABSD31_10495 [Candidatus Binataceae bacterium]